MNVLLDLHGIVPEETKMTTGCDSLVRKWENIEKIAVQSASKLICVTDKMKEHIAAKYSRADEHFIFLPIIRDELREENSIDYEEKSISYKNAPLFIYAGGAQKWQRIEKMVAAINSSHLMGIILSPDKGSFNKLLKRNIPIKSVTPDGVVSHLKKSHLSFVLREDHIVNQVACPTKLIEAMTFGCLPIIESVHLGDFDDLGFSYLPLSEFMTGGLPSVEDYIFGIKNNKNIISQLLRKYKTNHATFLLNITGNVSFVDSHIKEIDRIAKAEIRKSFKNFFCNLEFLRPINLFRLIRFIF